MLNPVPNITQLLRIVALSLECPKALLLPKPPDTFKTLITRDALRLVTNYDISKCLLTLIGVARKL